MANWSQSHFLQSLGWATLNSFWQLALLWCAFLLATQLFRLSAHQRYQFAVTALITGFGWFVFSFVSFYQDPSISTLGIFDQAVSDPGNFFTICLIAASVAYLSLLFFPAYRLFRNWQYVKKIKREGLHKADVGYRLFVQKIGSHLGIGRKVAVYVSSLIQSPVTIGYLKPVILLPVAALNHLSVQQVEAVLLHELSHIRRFDYLVNFITSIIHTLLYFNPFVKQFIRAIEAERENCCDELVLQFGYDKVGYATALLTLEKISAHKGALALAATGRNSLLNRIEKIVGMEKKKTFRGRQLVAILASLFFIAVFNSVLIIREQKETVLSYDYSSMGNPFALFRSDEEHTDASGPKPAKHEGWVRKTKKAETAPTDAIALQPVEHVMIPDADQVADEAGFVQVASDDVDASLTELQKKQVSEAVEATRKMVASQQWQQIESQIGDVLSEKEKQEAELAYRQEIDKINWQNVERNLKAQYNRVDWTRINGELSQAQSEMQLDSLQREFQKVYVELSKVERELAAQKNTVCSPIPDASVDEIRKARLSMKAQIDQIKKLKAKAHSVKL